MNFKTSNRLQFQSQCNYEQIHLQTVWWNCFWFFELRQNPLILNSKIIIEHWNNYLLLKLIFMIICLHILLTQYYRTYYLRTILLVIKILRVRCCWIYHRLIWNCSLVAYITNQVVTWSVLYVRITVLANCTIPGMPAYCLLLCRFLTWFDYSFKSNLPYSLFSLAHIIVYKASSVRNFLLFWIFISRLHA